LKMNLLENSPNDFELRAFCEGCKITAEEFNKMMPDLRVLLILRAFDKLRWAIDRKLANLHDYVTEAIMTVKKYQLNNEYEKQN